METKSRLLKNIRGRVARKQRIGYFGNPVMAGNIEGTVAAEERSSCT